MARTYYNMAMREALREEMIRDPNLVVIGEDVTPSVFGYTRDLRDEFGANRVRNTPIAETTTVGAALGAAASGLRVVVDLMMANFMYTGMDQLANQVAKLRYMTGGQFKVPVTFVGVEGIGGYIAAQHSDIVHSVFMNLGGIKVVSPTSPSDAKGLFKSAIRDDNPVMFLIPQMLLGSRGNVPDGEYTIPIGVADVRQKGTDVTVVAIGYMIKEVEKAAKELEKDGVSVEIIDPRTLHPLDEETILASVAKTGRFVVVDESRELCSAASHIAAIVAEKAFDKLKAPPRRVATLNVPIPFSPPMEDFVVPKAERVTAVIREVIGH
jgi:pyruvate dehydrogenase E1 component beta subunit